MHAQRHGGVAAFAGAFVFAGGSNLEAERYFENLPLVRMRECMRK